MFFTLAFTYTFLSNSATRHVKRVAKISVLYINDLTFFFIRGLFSIRFCNLWNGWCQ